MFNFDLKILLNQRASLLITRITYFASLYMNTHIISVLTMKSIFSADSILVFRTLRSHIILVLFNVYRDGVFEIKKTGIWKWIWMLSYYILSLCVLYCVAHAFYIISIYGYLPTYLQLKCKICVKGCDYPF